MESRVNAETKDVGYHSVKTFTDFNIHSHEEDAHRLFFVAKK